MTTKNFAIGIFDWGIGGLSVYKEIIKNNPATSICYFSDSGFTPYGKLSRPELEARLFKVVEWFKSQEVSVLVIACNAASTAADTLRQQFSDCKIYDIISAAINLVSHSPFKKVGVIGGQRTVDSDIYPKALRAKNFLIEQRIAQPLSALVEQGIITGSEVAEQLQLILSGFSDIEALLLACTHYPALSPEISLLYPQWTLLDPAAELAKTITELTPTDNASHFKHKEFNINTEFYTSGNPKQMVISANKAFGIRIENCNSCELN
jgi:glutamate racemase